MHTVGTVASGAFVLTKLGGSGSVIAGYAIGNRLVTGGQDSVNVQPTEEALANALLWAGAPDLLAAAMKVVGEYRSGRILIESLPELEAAIAKATVAATVKEAA